MSELEDVFGGVFLGREPEVDTCWPDRLVASESWSARGGEPAPYDAGDVRRVMATWHGTDAQSELQIEASRPELRGLAR